MYKEQFVEYIDHNISEIVQSEILSWSAFCDLCSERGVEIIFCCATDDPRVNVE